MKSQVLQLLVSQLFVGTGARLLAGPREENLFVVPRQTDHVKHRLAGQVPEPTSPPKLAARDFRLLKRDPGTCGYADGEKAYPLECGNGYYCFNDPAVSMIDCCSSANVDDCTAAVTCLDSSQSSLWDGSRATWVCSESDAPSCITRRYSDSQYSGYTWIACGVSGNDFGTAYYTPTDDPTATVTRTTVVISTTGATSMSSSPTSSSSAPVTTTTQPPQSQGSSVPIGAIVGGALGGLAVIALIGFGIFFICLQNKRRKQDTTQPAVGGGQVTPIQPQPIPIQETKFNYYQPSMASPPTSPVPPYSPPLTTGGTISPMSAVTNVGFAQPPPQPQPQQQYFAHAELDTARGDGQVRELP